jgi:tetratricopeptide (TPR) repeat protein
VVFLLVLAAIADEMRRSQSRGIVATAVELARYGVDTLAEIAASVIASRKDASELPGLQAQMPGSALVRVLNGSRGRGELYAVAGDAEPAPDDWLATLRFWLIDSYYKRDHDLVVDTRAMLDGPVRETRKVQFRRGADVNHFCYFGNQDSAQALAAALTDDPETDSLFKTYSGIWPLPGDATRGLFSPRPKPDPGIADAKGIVILVPGLCGSDLRVAQKDIWANVLELAAGQFCKTLHIDNPAVTPGSPLADSYLALANYLRNKGYIVRMHGYDWRNSILSSTQALADSIGKTLKDAADRKLPVHAIVHSMGGVLIRATFSGDDKLWAAWNDQPGRDARVVMLGTPNQGSHAVTQLFTARDDFFGNLALLDLHHSQAELLQTAVTFPGVLELLPSPDNVNENGEEIRDPKTWKDYGDADNSNPCRWPLPPPIPLADSASLWEALKQKDPLIGSDRLIYVAGKSDRTYSKAQIKEGEFILETTEEGDGRVTWATGIPASCIDGKRRYYMNALHGDMAKKADAFPALLELLETGKTTVPALSLTPPVTRGRAFEVSAPSGPSSLLYPTRAALLAAATGGSLMATAPLEPPAATVRVSVTHGNLMFARSPVLVGHMQGNNNLEQAERRLNQALNGRMKQRLDAGLYAGPLGTYSLFPKQADEKFASGAIVVGMGRIGQLSPGQLSVGVARALAAYAIHMMELHDGSDDGGRDEGGALELSVSALLIGAGVGEMSLADSVAAILRGHQDANQRLRDAGLAERVRLAELEILELLEDRAIQALNAARDAVSLDGELRRAFVVDAVLSERDGGWRRPYADEAEGAWQRLSISTVAGNDQTSPQLLFNVYGSLARVEQITNGVPLSSIEELVRRLIRTESDEESIGRTLFELMLPNWLKDQAPDRRRVQLVLDKAAAAYPWELFRDRSAIHGDRVNEPVSVRSGLVRQLSTGQFRTSVKRPSDHAALVVGDPELGATTQYFPSLTGAKNEAYAIQELLVREGFDAPDPMVRANVERTLIALYSRDWRILHLSGHGVYKEPLSTEPNAPKHTGMLIGENMVLTPAHIEQMRVVPDLVFLNCCSLGRIEADRAAPDGVLPGNPALAANLATQLIEMGVRGVVAAGWRVLDDAASLFATTLYEAMLRGEPYGEAVLAARREVYDRYPRSNTWGAYQCYGDPTFILTRPGNAGGRTDKPIKYDYVAPAEVMAELERITLEARFASKDAEEKNRREERVDALARLCDKHGWLAQGTIQEAFGRLWGEYAEHDRAIACYRAAQSATDGRASLKSTEQLINMLTRKAGAMLDANRKEEDKEVPAVARTLLIKAEELVKGILGIGETRERLSLKGAILKRQLELAPRQEVGKLLKEIAVCYENAAALESRADRYYPAINALHTYWLRYATGELAESDLIRARSAVDELKRDLSHRPSANNFWERTYSVDLNLIESLLDLATAVKAGKPAPEFECVMRDYEQLLACNVSQRERESVVNTLKIYAGVVRKVHLPAKGRAKTQFAAEKAVLTTLDRLVRSLDAGGMPTASDF